MSIGFTYVICPECKSTIDTDKLWSEYNGFCNVCGKKLGVRKEDYRYCETCKMFFDFWKYDYDLKSAGHDAPCKVRELTDEEYVEALKSCEESGCFEE